VETGGEGPCEFPPHTAGFPSRQGRHQTDLDCCPAGTYHHRGTATLEPAQMVESPSDSALLPRRSTHVASAQSVGGRSWTAFNHLFSRLDVVQTHLGPMQSGRRLILRKISKIGATRCQVLRLKCTKPQTPQTPCPYLRGLLLRGGGNEREREVREEGKGRVWKEKRWEGYPQFGSRDPPVKEGRQGGMRGAKVGASRQFFFPL